MSQTCVHLRKGQSQIAKPGLGNWQGLPGFIAGRKKASPAADDFFIRPRCGDVGVEAHEHVQMVVHDREPADGDREDIRKFLQSKFDPFFAVKRSFGEQECAADTAGDAVIPARHGYVDELRASHCRGWNSWVVVEITHLTGCVNIALRVLFLQVNEEPKRLPPFLDQLALVLENRCELMNLVDDAPVLRVVF